MKIGLIDADAQGKAKRYPNIALGKIARYHRAKGDEVEWALPFDKYDVIYISKVFNFTPEFDLGLYRAKKILKGGSGYDLFCELPDAIDRLQPDYSIYPDFPKDTAYGFLTRGCIRRCKWCVVPKKEGYVKPYMDVDEIAIEGRTKLVLMDNNILASGEYGLEQLRKIADRGYRVDFNQALDARLVNEENAKLPGEDKVDRPPHPFRLRHRARDIRLRAGDETYRRTGIQRRLLPLRDARQRRPGIQPRNLGLLAAAPVPNPIARREPRLPILPAVPRRRASIYSPTMAEGHGAVGKPEGAIYNDAL